MGDAIAMQAGIPRAVSAILGAGILALFIVAAVHFGGSTSNQTTAATPTSLAYAEPAVTTETWFSTGVSLDTPKGWQPVSPSALHTIAKVLNKKKDAKDTGLQYIQGTHTSDLIENTRGVEFTDGM